MDAYIMDTIACGDVYRAIEQAIALSATRGGPVTLNWPSRATAFVTMTVMPDSDFRLICRDRERILDGCIPDQVVGPYPTPVLSAEERAHDARIRQENEQRYQAARAEILAEKEARCAVLEAKLAPLPGMATLDQAAWERFVARHRDPFTTMTIDFAVPWVRLMQAELAQGKPFEEAALSTIEAADVGNVADRALYQVVPILAQHWVHGAALLEWFRLYLAR